MQRLSALDGPAPIDHCLRGSKAFKRRPVGGALAPVAAVTCSHQDCRSGVCGYMRRLSGAWQTRNRDYVSEKRCSRLGLIGCDPDSGYAAQDLRTRETELAYGSLLLRVGVRATPSSSPVVCRIVSAPPLRAPARVTPGRTLVEGEGRVGSRASPQLQSTPLFKRWWVLGVPVPVLPVPKSAQEFAGFSIAIAI